MPDKPSGSAGRSAAEGGVEGMLTTLSVYTARTMSWAAFLYLSRVSSTGWYMAPRTFLPNRSLSMLSTFTCRRQGVHNMKQSLQVCPLQTYDPGRVVNNASRTCAACLPCHSHPYRHNGTTLS